MTEENLPQTEAQTDAAKEEVVQQAYEGNLHTEALTDGVQAELVDEAAFQAIDSANESEQPADLGQHGHAAAQLEDPEHVNPHGQSEEQFQQ